MGLPRARKKAVATTLLGAEALVVVEAVQEVESDRHPISSAMFAERRDTSAGTARTESRNKELLCQYNKPYVCMANKTLSYVYLIN